MNRRASNKELPDRVERAFAGKMSIGAPALCKAFEISRRTLARHIYQGHVTFHVKGVGGRHPPRFFTRGDAIKLWKAMLEEQQQ